MKYIVFIRHAETVKNINQEFSKENKIDNLTEKGLTQAKNIASFLQNFIKEKELKVKNIYTADSFRAIDTGNVLSQYLSVPIVSIPMLTSYNMGEAEGMAENDTKNKHPLFYEQLQLYRNGLLNSYDIEYPLGAEKPSDFEERVSKGIDKILCTDTKEENIKIIILHRSSLTATYIRFAREYYKYPNDFYGFVPIDNGCMTLLKKDNDVWSFKCVNLNPSILSSFGDDSY